MLNKHDLFKIGIGTWGIGGFAQKDTSIDEGKQREALTYMFEKGFNFVEANLWYSEGYAAEILAKALKNSSKKREDIFICQAIYIKGEKSFDQAKKELDKVMELFETNYIDTLQFSMESFLRYPFEELTDWIEELLNSGNIRYTSITNENLELLNKYHQRFKDKFFSHEVVFNFEIRVNEELGIIPYAQENNIQTVVYQPLRRNRTTKRNWEPLVKLSEKYGKTQNQIIMNWIVEKGYLPLTKSETIAHIDECLDSLNFQISDEDRKLLDNYKISNYNPPPIDWNRSGNGVSVDQLSNVFDDIC